MSVLSSQPHATAAGSIISTDRRHQHCCCYRLVDAGGAPHAASGLGSAEWPASKQTRGLDAGECRGAARACLHEHSRRDCSLRSHPSKCPIPPARVHPWQHSNVHGCQPRTRASWEPTKQNNTLWVPRVTARAVSASDAGTRTSAYVGNNIVVHDGSQDGAP